MIDYLEEPEKATEFVSKKLVEVKHILDEITEETGVVYVAMPESQVSIVAQIGMQWASWLNGAHKIIADRLNLSLEHKNWMLERHPDNDEDAEKKPHQDDLFDDKQSKKEV